MAFNAWPACILSLFFEWRRMLVAAKTRSLKVRPFTRRNNDAQSVSSHQATEVLVTPPVVDPARIYAFYFQPPGWSASKWPAGISFHLPQPAVS
ncbi:MAG: hypothetical protein FWD68_03245 [Alphaproteobacteria bacterium]|nr:hypothetical protein [Alphaproteobacteria bacterium]